MQSTRHAVYLTLALCFIVFRPPAAASAADEAVMGRERRAQTEKDTEKTLDALMQYTEQELLFALTAKLHAPPHDRCARRHTRRPARHPLTAGFDPHPPACHSGPGAGTDQQGRLGLLRQSAVQRRTRTPILRHRCQQL